MKIGNILAGLKGCSETNLKLCRNFYLNYPEIGQAASDQSSEYGRLILSQNKKAVELSKRGQVLENPQDLLVMVQTSLEIEICEKRKSKMLINKR